MQLKIGTGSYEVVSLVVPGLGPEIILGVDLMELWKAKLDLGNFNMTIEEREKVDVVPFIEEDMGRGQTSLSEPGLESELFFVEKVEVYDQEKIAMVECVDPGSYERNLPYDEVERGLFLFTGNEVCVTDPLSESAEIQILSVQVYDRIYSVLKRKVDEIEGINEMQKEKFYREFRENIEVFSHRIGLCTAYTHEFQVVNPTPYTHKCRNVPLAMLEKTDQAIQKMLRENIIEESDSENVNALCLVQKTDGSARVTIDAHQLKSMTLSNHYRSEPVQAQINKVNSAKWYSILDLTQASCRSLWRNSVGIIRRSSIWVNNIALHKPISGSPQVVRRSPEHYIKCSVKN